VTQPTVPSPAKRTSERDLLLTLFDLSLQVTSVLDQDELFAKIQELLARVIPFDAFAVYLLDKKGGELRIAYPFGYPPGIAEHVHLKVGEGVVGLAVAEQRPMIFNDVAHDPRYKNYVPGMNAALVVPLIYKTRVIGALNILSRQTDVFDETDLLLFRQFAAHVAVALENARLFERERENAEVFETLAEIGREVASILDLDELLTRIAQLIKRVVDYRTFGIMLLNDQTQMLEFKLAIQYSDVVVGKRRLRLDEGLAGYAATHKVPVNVPDVSQDSRYVKIMDDVQSELVIPLLLKDRCIGVFDLNSPQLDAFDKHHVEVLTLLANHAAAAIENARLYQTVVDNEERLEKEVRFAQRVQAALLPTELPKRLRGVDVAARFAPARELGGDFHDFLAPEPNSLVVALGDVSGKGVPAALYSAFASELVRGRTFRRRYTNVRTTPAGILLSMNTILHQRQLEEYYCTLCYASFDLKRRHVTLANSGLPYPIRCNKEQCAQIELPGVPLGSFAGSTYDEITLPLETGDVFVFCSDGISEGMNEAAEEFTSTRLLDVVARSRDLTARGIVDAIFEAVAQFRGLAAQNDDMTAVALKVTS
jgi:sigma-B regulation protein RsbU (phosphoserine phosphatase)